MTTIKRPWQIARFRRLINISATLLILISWLVTLNRMGKFPLGRTEIPIEIRQADSGYAVRSQSFPREILIRGLDVRLVEENTELRRDPLTTTESVRESGGGRFMIWNDGTILFSATDQSDPITNGKRYAITMPIVLNNKFARIVYLTTAFSLVLWCLTKAKAIYESVKKTAEIFARRLACRAGCGSCLYTLLHFDGPADPAARALVRRNLYPKKLRHP